MEQDHTITIEQRKKITATAIESVDAFSDKQIVLSYAGGRIIVCGSNLKIAAFSKSGGGFSATGEITSFKYAAKGIKFAKKLFK